MSMNGKNCYGNGAYEGYVYQGWGLGLILQQSKNYY